MDAQRRMPNSQVDRKVRVVMLGSFYRGYYLLNELLFGDIGSSVEVVGVATDDPSNTFISPGKRVWQYPHTIAEAEMVEKLALQSGLDVYKDRVNSQPFYDLLDRNWKPWSAKANRSSERVLVFILTPCLSATSARLSG